MTQLPRLCPSMLYAGERTRLESSQRDPIRILQIGEGDFLRGFFDWMIHECRKQGVYAGRIVVTPPRPSGSIKIAQLYEQQGLFTLLVRGQDRGQTVEYKEVISVFASVLNPYDDWGGFLRLAENPDLEVVVSNTTEAGLVYERVPFIQGESLAMFPAKLTVFLYHRFCHFDAAADKGLVILPCELVTGNGDLLLTYVLQHARDWGFPARFLSWLRNHSQFLNSLVDRIVTGYPHDDAPGLFRTWGYEDPLLTATEPYYFWAIQGDASLESKLPFNRAGLNVQWVENLEPFQKRKVRVLNGAHTLMAVMGLLRGFGHVRQTVQDPQLGETIRMAIAREIVPFISLDEREVVSYAESVWERFCNPFVEHRLTDIAMNTVSKFRVRLLPTIMEYHERTAQLPPIITQCFAELIRLYHVDPVHMGGTVVYRSHGLDIVVRDSHEVIKVFQSAWDGYGQGRWSIRHVVNTILRDTALWGQNLLPVTGLEECLERHLTMDVAGTWSANGVKSKHRSRHD